MAYPRHAASPVRSAHGVIDASGSEASQEIRQIWGPVIDGDYLGNGEGSVLALDHDPVFRLVTAYGC